MEKSNIIIRNVMYSFLAQGVLVFVSLFSSPFIIHRLGNDPYGVMAIVIAFMGYLSIIDFGFGQAIVKYISENNGQGGEGEIEKIVQSSLTLFGILGITGSLLVVLFAPFITENLLKIPPYLFQTTLTVMYISSIGFLISMITIVPSSVLVGIQRIDITSKRNIIFGVIYTVGVVGLLVINQSLIAIVIWSTILNFIALVLYLVTIKRILPYLKLKLGFDVKIFKKLARYSIYKFIASVTGQIVFYLDKGLIAYFLPISAVTFYSGPALLMQKIFALVSNITTAVFPAMSQLYREGQTEKITSLYVRTTRFILFMILPMVALIYVYAYNILFQWLGIELANKGTQTLKILILGYVFVGISAPAVIVADAFGRPKIPAIFSIFSALINFIVCIVLIPRLGIEGAAYALLINGILQVPIFVYYVTRNIVRISIVKYIRQSFMKPVLAVLCTLLIYALLIKLTNNPIVGVFTVLLSYLIMNMILKTFDESDRGHFMNLMFKLKLIMKYI